jgi:hypothetical protein
LGFLLLFARDRWGTTVSNMLVRYIIVAFCLSQEQDDATRLEMARFSYRSIIVTCPHRMKKTGVVIFSTFPHLFFTIY